MAARPMQNAWASIRSVTVTIGPVCLVLLGLFLGIAALSLDRLYNRHPGLSVYSQLPADRGTSDCAAVSLYIACRLTGRDISLEELGRLTKIGPAGTSMYELKHAAAVLGFEVFPCRCTFTSLCSHLSNPDNLAILHSPKSHFVAVTGIKGSKTSVRLIDPVLGVRDLLSEDLAQLLDWDGSALLLRSSKT